MRRRPNITWMTDDQILERMIVLTKDHARSEGTSDADLRDRAEILFVLLGYELELQAREATGHGLPGGDL